MVTVEEAERKLRRRGAMRSHLARGLFDSVRLAVCDGGRGRCATAGPARSAACCRRATPPQAAAAAVEHAAPAGSPADAAANVPAETRAECMQADSDGRTN